MYIYINIHISKPFPQHPAGPQHSLQRRARTCLATLPVIQRSIHPDADKATESLICDKTSTSLLLLLKRRLPVSYS